MNFYPSGTIPQASRRVHTLTTNTVNELGSMVFSPQQTEVRIGISAKRKNKMILSAHEAGCLGETESQLKSRHKNSETIS